MKRKIAAVLILMLAVLSSTAWAAGTELESGTCEVDLEQMNEQAGKRNEKRFSLPGIRLPRLRLPHLDGPTWTVLLMGAAALLMLWWGLDTVWSSLSLLSL